MNTSRIKTGKNETSWQRKLLESTENPLLSKGKIRTIRDVDKKADELILNNRQSLKEKTIKIKEIICQKIKTKPH